jgi:hypothetical protein
MRRDNTPAPESSDLLRTESDDGRYVRRTPHPIGIKPQTRDGMVEVMVPP